MAFDHERLNVYKASLDFVSFAAKLAKKLEGRCGDARDQLMRASLSIPLNIAEGNAKRSPGDRRRFFEIARGSAMESAAILDVLVAMEACSPEDSETGKRSLVPVVAMLTKMTEYPASAREEASEYSED